MYFVAHSDDASVGSQSLGHLYRENSLKIAFISFIFIALTYLVAILFNKITAKNTEHKHKEAETHE